jgi:hypothetical protein
MAVGLAHRTVDVQDELGELAMLVGLVDQPVRGHHRIVRSSARPQIEILDDRVVPAGVTYLTGGQVLSHVDVQNVFYGQDWNRADPTGNIRNTLIDFQKNITTSAYMAMLGDYGVGRGHSNSYDPVYSGPTLGGTVTETQIQSMVQAQISAGRVKAETGQQLYFVYLPPSYINLSTHQAVPAVKDGWDVANRDAAHHGSFLMNGTPVYYAVIPTGSGSIPNATVLSSHELAEAVTDPDLRQLDTTTDWANSHVAWMDSTNNEIGDGLAGQTVQFTTNGETFTVQREWSTFFNWGIAPYSNSNGMLDAAIPGMVHAGTWSTGGPTVQLNYAIYDRQVLWDWQLSDGTAAGWFSVV